MNRSSSSAPRKSVRARRFPRRGNQSGRIGRRNGKLYVSNRLADTIIELDTDSGRRTGEIRVKAAGALAAVNRGLYAISGRGLVAIQSETRQVRPLSDADVAEPVGLAVDKSGRLYVSDAVTHTVRICDAMGCAVGQLGKPGGRYTGRYDPQRMVNPRGLAVAANGWLWVTEDRQNPKRVVAWDPETKRVMKEEFGPPPTARRAPAWTIWTTPVGSDRGRPGNWTSPGRPPRPGDTPISSRDTSTPMPNPRTTHSAARTAGPLSWRRAI